MREGGGGEIWGLDWNRKGCFELGGGESASGRGRGRVERQLCSRGGSEVAITADGGGGTGEGRERLRLSTLPARENLGKKLSSHFEVGPVRGWLRGVQQGGG